MTQSDLACRPSGIQASRTPWLQDPGVTTSVARTLPQYVLKTPPREPATAEYELDVLVPVYNEGANIRRTLDVLFQSNRVPFRLHICYDRDDDNTLPELEKCPAWMRGRIDLIKNEGKGAHGAICTGFRRSTAAAVVVYPADDDYNPGVLDRMFQKWKDEACEIVAASRFVPGGCMVGCPWLKATLVRCSAFALYNLAGLPTHDPSNGFRLFSRRVLDRFAIESTAGFVYSIELLVKTHRAGWKIGEVPAQWRERTRGSSRFRVIRWLPAYLRWFFYAFASSYLGRETKAEPYVFDFSTGEGRRMQARPLPARTDLSDHEMATH